ncbi:MAG TPA: sterol desaturase family protein [Ktedonobacterales bacterium]|jgi:sterol desaturase/sphingolipid hydroxylase (fatty acid hydroxylase superfamily)
MSFVSDVIRAAVGLLILALLFGLLEWLWPEDRQQPRFRRDGFTDVLWWFMGYVTRFLASVSAAIVAVIAIRLVPLQHPWLPQISQQPAWLQTLEVLVIGDFLGYWIHRLFHHTPWLWPFHAIHHSSETLDWLSATRVHPVDSILHRLVPVALFYLLGFSGAVLGPFLVFLALYPIALHANLRWRFGWLGYLFVSPAFHRWHHTSEEMGLDKNFAGLFAIFDYIFGTAYLPKWQPTTYGLYQEKAPRGFFGQLAYPFRRKRPAAREAIYP